MNVCDCRWLLKFFEEEQIDSKEAYQRIEKESQNWIRGNRNEFWSMFTQQPAPVHDLLVKTVAKFEEERVPPGVAVELGCGNSQSAIYLLQKGWKVIAVDNSEGVLDHLKELVHQSGSNWIQDGQLTLVCQEMEEYQFPLNVRLIFARDALPYCNPNKLKIVWDRAYDSLEKGGRIAGNFFTPNHTNPTADIVQRVLMGVWFTEKAVVNALLDDRGYEKEVLGYNKYWFEPDPRCIEFIAHKINSK